MPTSSLRVLPSIAVLAVLAGTSLLGPCSASGRAPRSIDDFEDGDLGAAPGAAWFVIADDQIGGASTAAVEPLAPGAGESRGALRLSGRTVPGDRGGFAGAWSSLDPDGRTVDLSGHSGLRFWVRGDGGPGGQGRFSVAVRCTDGSRFAHFSAPFAAGAEWLRVEVALADMEQTLPPAPPYEWTGRDAVALGFVSAGAGDFTLDVDGIELVPAAGSGDRPAAAVAGPGRISVAEIAPLDPAAEGWTPLASEPEPDARFPALPDARNLLVRYDPAERRVWFRLDLHDEPPRDWLGLNLALDTDGDPANGTPWWNVNKEFRFDRLVTVWLNRTGAVYRGVVGVASAEAVGRFEMGDVARDLRVARSVAGRALAVGIPLDALGGARRLALVATVGSSVAANDDLPDHGAVTLDLGALIAAGGGE